MVYMVVYMVYIVSGIYDGIIDHILWLQLWLQSEALRSFLAMIMVAFTTVFELVQQLPKKFFTSMISIEAFFSIRKPPEYINFLFVSRIKSALTCQFWVGE